MIVRPEHFDSTRDNEAAALAKDPALSSAEKSLLRELGREEPFFTEPPTFCFYCGEKLTIPAIIWHGRHATIVNETSEIWLHPRCAEQLTATMARDVNELKIGKSAADAQLQNWKRDHPSPFS